MKCNYDADLDMKEQNVMSNTDKCAAQIIIPREGVVDRASSLCPAVTTIRFNRLQNVP